MVMGLAAVVIFGLLFLNSSVTAAGNTLIDRELQQEPLVCNIAGEPAFYDTRPTPIIPCRDHYGCKFFTGFTEGFEACCLTNCICGSTQFEFSTGINKCGNFACTSSDNCGPGLCVNGQCNYDNVQPLCSSHADCGENRECHNGRCYCLDENGNIEPGPKSGGNASNCRSSGSRKTTSTTTTVAAAGSSTTTGLSSSSSTTTAAVSSTGCATEGMSCGAPGDRPCCFPSMVCRMDVCVASLQGDLFSGRNKFLKAERVGDEAFRGQRGSRRRRRRFLKGSTIH